MKYPEHTISTPVLGKQADRIIDAIKTGKEITNPQREATIQRILKAREAQTKNATANVEIYNK
jgi:hypothetical protein